jgi:hypothetical protein
MIFFLSMYLWSIVGFAIHLFSIDRIERTRSRIVELFLLYQLFFSVGMTCLMAFLALTIMPDYIAKYTGWPECPFEQELGNVNLAFAVLGVLCIWFRGGFWRATILGFSIWIFADGIHHIIEAIEVNNYTPGNIGVNLITDLAVPIVLMAALPFYDKG